MTSHPMTDPLGTHAAKRQNYILGFTGMRGQGKSATMKEELRRAGDKRIVIVDPMLEHTDIAVPMRGEINDILLSLDDAFRNHERFRFAIAAPVDDDEKEIFMRHIANYCCDNAKGKPVTLVVDEIDYFCTRTSCNSGLNRVIQYGRHYPVNLVWSARSLQSVYIRLTSETNITRIFCVYEPAWLDAIQERWGQDVAEMVRALPYHDPSQPWEIKDGKVTFEFIQVNINGKAEKSSISIPAKG